MAKRPRTTADATASPAIPRYQLAPGLEISRLVTGLWQVADLEREGGLGLDRAKAVAQLAAHHEAGLTSFDMADHYGSAEELICAFHGSRPDGMADVQVFTKWVPKPGAQYATKETVDAAVALASQRLGVAKIPLLQLHTWDYLDGPGNWLKQLKRLQTHESVAHVGMTNTDTAHIRLALAEGVPIVSNQICFSLLDRRALGPMSALCAEKGVRLLAFGVLAGGLLTDRYLNRAEPTEAELKVSWSLAKYRRFVHCFGGWELLQELLRTLRRVADRHLVDGSPVSIANVSTRWILQQPAVAAVIVGARLGIAEHVADNQRVFGFELSSSDLAEVDAVLARSQPIHGDCGDEYRRAPFLTASGDLSHHLSEVPNAFTTRELAGHSQSDPKLAIDFGSALAGPVQAVRRGRRIVVSGAEPLDPLDGVLVGGTDAEAQATVCLDLVSACLKALGACLGDVVCTRVYLRNKADQAGVQRALALRFSEHATASTMVLAAPLVEGALVTIEADAEVSA